MTVALVVSGGATLTLALPLPLPLLGAACVVTGLAAGLPFAAVFGAAQRLRPDAPAASIGFVNAVAVLTIVAGTPLAGIAFDLPGDGRLAFAAIGVLCAAAAVAARRAPLQAP